MKNLSDIGAERSVYVGSGFDDSYIDGIIEKLFVLNQQDGHIVLYINSTGGKFSATKKLYDNVLLGRNKVIGVVAGLCYGGAVAILQACDKRYTTPLSDFKLFYSGQYVTFGVINDKPIDQYMELIKSKIAIADNYRETMLKMLKRKVVLDEKHIHELLIKSRSLSAAEALKFGLIDEIIDI